MCCLVCRRCLSRGSHHCPLSRRQMLPHHNLSLLWHQLDSRGTTQPFRGQDCLKLQQKSCLWSLAINLQQLKAELTDTWLRKKEVLLSFLPSFPASPPCSPHSYSVKMMLCPQNTAVAETCCQFSDPQMADGYSLQPLPPSKMSSSVPPGPQQNAFGKHRRKG